MKKSDSFRSLQKQTAWKTAVARVLNWPINGNCIAPDWSILFCQAVIYFPLSTVCFESCQFLTSDLSFWILVLENVKSENWTVKTERFKFLCDNYLPYMPLTSLWTWTCSEPSSEPDMAEPREMEKFMFLFFSMIGMRLMRPPEARPLNLTVTKKRDVLPLWTLRM